MLLYGNGTAKEEFVWLNQFIAFSNALASELSLSLQFWFLLSWSLIIPGTLYLLSVIF